MIWNEGRKGGRGEERKAACNVRRRGEEGKKEGMLSSWKEEGKRRKEGKGG